MKRYAFCFLLALAALGLGNSAGAATFRWASAGDIQTSDPYSQNVTLTNLFSQQVYDSLVTRDKDLRIVPGLATSWQQVTPTTWRFVLRRGVKFHDGSAFTADDVVFSYERASHVNSQLRQYAIPVGKPRKVDDYTVDFVQDKPNPITLEHAASIYIMSKAWCVAHKVELPLSFKDKEETFASRNAMGTGPYMLISREPEVRTVLKRNDAWWGGFQGNVTEIIYMPIRSDATRLAALLSGEVDFILDPPTQDIARLRSDPKIKIVEGPENRIIFFGFDQKRDELLYSSVKGKNPFKDMRVRRAVYQAIDIAALHSRVMRNSSLPTGGITPSILGSTPEAEKRLPYDVDAAKKLLTDAGYGAGFEVTLDCPNNRYINDEQICLAVAAMLAKIGIQTKVATQPQTNYFPKLERGDTSFYMLGWGGATTDAQTTLLPVLHSTDEKSGTGSYNYGHYVDRKLDELIDAAAVEMNPDKRKDLIARALAEHNGEVLHVPLHRQVIPWAMRTNVSVVHRADNLIVGEWTNVETPAK